MKIGFSIFFDTENDKMGVIALTKEDGEVIVLLHRKRVQYIKHAERWIRGLVKMNPSFENLISSNQWDVVC